MLTRIRAWYRRDDQCALRREVAWTLRWLRGWRGLSFVGLYAAPYVFWAVFKGSRSLIEAEPVQAGCGAGGIYVILGGYFVGLNDLILATYWAYLMHVRTLRLFQPDRLGDTLATRLAPRDVWPAALAAPIILVCIAGCLDAVYAFAVSEIAARDPQTIARLAREPNLVRRPERLLRVMQLHGLAIGAAVFAARGAAITALTALLTLTRPEWSAILLRGFWSWALVVGPWVPLCSILTPKMSYAGWFILTLALGIAPIGYCCGLSYVCLKRLRSPKTWDRLRRAAEGN